MVVPGLPYEPSFRFTADRPSSQMLFIRRLLFDQSLRPRFAPLSVVPQTSARRSPRVDLWQLGPTEQKNTLDTRLTPPTIPPRGTQSDQTSGRPSSPDSLSVPSAFSRDGTPFHAYRLLAVPSLSPRKGNGISHEYQKQIV